MKLILVALDSSPRAPLVLQAAMRLAELANAKLALYRAVGMPPELPGELFKLTDVRLDDFLRERGRADLERLAQELRPELIASISTTLAIPWDGICGTAREHDADLIVVGSHGYGGIDRLLGTTAAKVVNHADRNVLVVRTAL